MLWDFSLLLVGGLLLYFGAEWFVRGAASLALRLGVRQILIGLTVVSYATSAPELSVSLVAALDGKSDISLGNVVGSNIANVGLILGITALISPPHTDGSLLYKELAVLLVATALLPVVLLDGNIGTLDGILFTLGAILFTYLTVRWSRQRPPPTDEVEEVVSRSSVFLLIGLIAGGLAVLIAGGEVFVRGAVGMAQAFGVSDRIVGLTIVALGTSLPELAASLVAALRGHSELAVGNVVGSNIFNLLLILGVTASVVPIAGDLGALRFDLITLGALTVVVTIALRSARRLSRAEGVVMLAAYVGFMVVTFVRG